LDWRRHRIPWLSWILDRLTRILWLPRILWLDWLTGVLGLPRILGLRGRVGLTGELLQLLRVLWLLSGVLLRLPQDRRILRLSCLTSERRWRGLTRILDRLARQLSWILKLTGVLRLLASLRLYARKIHLLGLRGIWRLPWLNGLPWIGRVGRTGISRLSRITWLCWIARLCWISRLAWKRRLPRLGGILRVLRLRILGLRVGVALGERLFRPVARNAVARSPQSHVQSRIDRLAVLVGGGLRSGGLSTGWSSRRLRGRR
jgi:hypothetical protein